MTERDQWKPVESAPFDHKLELAVIEGKDVHALIFACCRVVGGWVNAATRERVPVHPTHWRDWDGNPLDGI
jgi:hypothetical protein